MRFYKAVLIICVLLVSSLSSAGEYAGGVQTKVILKTATTGNGAPIAYLKTDQPEITAMTVDVAPGAETGWHMHSVPVYAYVLSGSLTVDIEGTISRQFIEGNVIIEVVNTRHNGVNKGSIPVKLIVFYTGARDMPTVLKTASP